MLSVGRNTAQQWNKLLFPCRTSLGSTSCDNHWRLTAMQNTTDDQDAVSVSPRHVTSTESIEHCVMGNGGDIETCDAPFSSQKSMIWSLNSLNKAKNKVIDKEGTCVDSSSPSRLSHPRLCTLCPSGNVATIFAQGYDNGWSEHLKSKRKGSARKWMWWVALLDSTLHKSRFFFFHDWCCDLQFFSSCLNWYLAISWIAPFTSSMLTPLPQG